MLYSYLRSLTASERTGRADRHLGLVLAGVAGATNAGGILAVGRYTSHVTGTLSSLADDVGLGHAELAGTALSVLGAFVAGAFLSSVLVQWARSARLASEFALPLAIEAALLLAFALLGGTLHRWTGWGPALTLCLLSFMMGLQNAIITKMSHGVVRTTHVTGLVTDIGVELGRAAFRATTGVDVADVAPDENARRLATHVGLVAAFFTGGVFGAYAFQRVGFVSALPLACVVLTIAAPPLLQDVRDRFRAAT